MRPLWIISYDISCSKRLKKINKRCAQEGWALQKSVYVIAAFRNERILFCNELVGLIDEEEDKLLCLPFITGEGSFHKGNKNDWCIIHSDERLNDFVF